MFFNVGYNFVLFTDPVVHADALFRIHVNKMLPQLDQVVWIRSYLQKFIMIFLNLKNRFTIFLFPSHWPQI